MTVPIVVNYAVLENANAELQNTAKVLGENLSSLHARLQNMDWEGQDQAAYHQHLSTWSNAVQELHLLLNEIGIKVGDARQRYAANEMRGVARWG